MRLYHRAALPPHLLLGLRVDDGFTRRNQLLLQDRLNFGHFAAGVFADDHDAVGETLHKRRHNSVGKGNEAAKQYTPVYLDKIVYERSKLSSSA